MNPSGVLEKQLNRTNLTLPNKWGGVVIEFTIDAYGRVVITAPADWRYSRYSPRGIAEFILRASPVSGLLQGRSVDQIKLVLKDPALTSRRWPVIWQGQNYSRPGFQKGNGRVTKVSMPVAGSETTRGRQSSAGSGGYGLVPNLNNYNTGLRALNHGHR